MNKGLKSEKDRVKYIALALGVTLKGLSVSLGFKPTTLSAYLNKEEGLTLTALMELHRKYKVSMDWVKFGVGEPFCKK